MFQSPNESPRLIAAAATYVQSRADSAASDGGYSADGARATRAVRVQLGESKVCPNHDFHRTPSVSHICPRVTRELLFQPAETHGFPGWWVFRSFAGATRGHPLCFRVFLCNLPSSWMMEVPPFTEAPRRNKRGVCGETDGGVCVEEHT